MGEIMFECFVLVWVKSCLNVLVLVKSCLNVLVLVKWMYEHTVWLLSNTMFDGLVWYG